MNDKVVLMADIRQDPFETNDTTAVVLAEAFKIDDVDDSVVVKLCLSMDHFLDCRSAARGKEEVYIVVNSNEDFEKIRKIMQFPTELAFYLKDGGYELHEVTGTESKTILTL